MIKKDAVITTESSIFTGKQRRFMPSFAVLRSFECAARHQSFTLAAEELSLTQSAISRQIKELELAIGADLFRRVHFDAALHFGPPVWPDGNLAKLCTEVMIAVASPSLIDTHDITGAADLLEAPLIHLETRPFAWNDWFSAAGIKDNGVMGGKQYGQFAMVIAGAIASLGAAILPSYLIEAELADGRLKSISDVGLSTQNAYYIATPKGIRNPAVDAFSTWVRGQINSPVPFD